jgi:YesN/AraC family two-component response regulator
MQIVSQGLSHRAEIMLSNFSKLAFDQRTADPIRNVKNYAIICNTLMRKAAESGGVHPIYLDSLSSDFAKRIENVTGVESAQALMSEMAHSYCRLVRKYAIRQYSPMVQKTVTYIGSNLSGDLSLSVLASTQNINASYLSSLFRKETGKTVTEYVNEKRMEAAAQLLRTTRLQIQTVAQHCGMSDVNYFSKLFKKHHEMTPKQYRDRNRLYVQNTKS